MPKKSRTKVSFELVDKDKVIPLIFFFKSIFEAHKNVYLLMQLFYKQNRLHMIWGNHDMVYRNPNYVKKNLSTYFDEKTVENVELFKDIKYHEGIILKHKNTNQEVFLTCLKDICEFDIDMSTMVIIGNEDTYIKNNKMITPRGYRH